VKGSPRQSGYRERLLASGEIDCALLARPPDCFRQGIERLFPNYRETGRFASD
jgi:hypothetical protein